MQNEARVFRFNKNIIKQNPSELYGKRYYYPAITANVEPIKGRIIKNSSVIKLETYESYTYKYKDFPIHRPFILDKLLPYFSSEFTWTEIFSISSAGEIIINRKKVISSEFVRFIGNKENSEFISRFHTPQTQFVPDLLFAIPQSIWDEFISNLTYQDVVRNINLSLHRHLWQSYNYAASAGDNDQIRHFRSTAVNKYHFLISNYSIYGYKNDYLGNDSYTSSFYRDFNVCKLFDDIDQGKSPTDILKYRLPYLTPIFLNKFSQYPLWNDIHTIGYKFILPKVINTKNEIDKKKLNEFISVLPCSKTSPRQFSEMISDSRKISSLKYFENEIKSQFFYHARLNFGHFKMKPSDGNDLRDYFFSLSNNLFFPELIRQLLTLPIQQFKNSRVKDGMDIVNGPFLGAASFKLINKISILLTESIYAERLMYLQERWHRNQTVINSKKPLPIFSNAWHALFSQEMIDEVSFICLTTEEELKQEGSMMNHCVGGYTPGCMKGCSHIIKIETLSGERSTLELSISQNNEQIDVVQNKGKNNSKPCAEIIAATQKLIIKLKQNQILLNDKRGKNR